jgi:hypothetical protein
MFFAGQPEIRHQAQVRQIFPHLSTTNMFEFLQTFTGFYNRLYTSKTGVESQRWLYNEILDVSGQIGRRSPLISLYCIQISFTILIPLTPYMTPMARFVFDPLCSVPICPNLSQSVPICPNLSTLHSTLSALLARNPLPLQSAIMPLH